MYFISQNPLKSTTISIYVKETEVNLFGQPAVEYRLDLVFSPFKATFIIPSHLGFIKRTKSYYNLSLQVNSHGENESVITGRAEKCVFMVKFLLTET